MKAALFGVLLVVTVQLAMLSFGKQILFENPNLRAFQASVHFWETGSLTNPAYNALHNRLLSQSDSKSWQDVYAETISGKLVPKLSSIFIILVSPILGNLGLAGIVIVNLIQWLIIIYCLFNVFRNVGGQSPVFFLFCLFLGTQAWSHALFPTLETNPVFLLSLAIFLSNKLPLFSGVLAGLSAFHRPTNAFCAVALGFHSQRRFEVLVGVGIGLFLFALFNYFVWGGFTTTQYHRMPFYEYGVVTYKSGVTSFELKNLLVEPIQKLFSSHQGIVTFNLILFCLLIPRSAPFPLVLNLIGQTILIMCYTSYEPGGHGYHSSYGNRYLTCSILLLLPYLAASLERVTLIRYKASRIGANHQNSHCLPSQK